MITAETKRTIGKKLYKAAEFVLDVLAEGEMATEEVQQLAARRGISGGTLKRARQVVCVKIRKASGRWYMVLPEGAREHFADCYKEPEPVAARLTSRSREIGTIASDWVAVITDSGEGGVCGPGREDGGLHVKVGAVEFTADSAFPTEKLIEILHGLGVAGGC
jgi:hypothetical protein